MKTVVVFAVFILLTLSQVRAQSQSTNLNRGRSTSTKLKSEKVRLVLEAGTVRGLEELNQASLEHLWQNGGMAKELKVETLVNIFPQNKHKVCEFLYFQGFGKPFWIVEVGHDGRIKNFRKEIATEGGLGRPSVMPPIDGKPPKGARIEPKD